MVLEQYIGFPHLNRYFYLPKNQKTIGQQIDIANRYGEETAKNARKFPKERQRGKVQVNSLKMGTKTRYFVFKVLYTHIFCKPFFCY